MSDVERLHELNEDFYVAFESGDLDAMEAIWANGDLAASVTCVHPGWPALRGRDEVMRSWAMIMANTTYIQFVLTDIEVEVGVDFALLTCVENILTADDEDTDENSSTFAGAKGVATNVFRRTENGWQLWVRHGSPVISNTSEDDDE